MLRINERLVISDTEIEENFIRSAGPGGQNVNKVATAVQLRFKLHANRSLTEDQKKRLGRIAGRRLTKEGEVIIEASNHRTQSANREEARRRLAQMIREALPRPVRRVPTKPTKGSVERRLEAKRLRSRRKANRSLPRADLD